MIKTTITTCPDETSVKWQTWGDMWFLPANDVPPSHKPVKQDKPKPTLPRLR